MRSAALSKTLACIVLSIMLCGCAPCLQNLCAKSPASPPGRAGCPSIVKKKPPGVSALISEDRFDPSEIGREILSHESELQRTGEHSDVTLTELARMCFMLGEFGEKSESERYFQKGRYYAEILSMEYPAKVEGHYWLGMNLAGLAEIGGAGRGLRLVPVIVDKMEVALGLDEAYDQGGPHRVLGRVRCQAPCWPLSEGDMEKSLEHLRTAVRIAPRNSTNHLFLAETLYKLGKTEEALLELQLVLASSCHSVCPAGFRDDCREALRLLKEYGAELKPESGGIGGEHSASGKPPAAR